VLAFAGFLNAAITILAISVGLIVPKMAID
jgi:hypothetical protein